MERLQTWAFGAQQAVGQTATTAAVLSLRGALVIVLSFVLLALRTSRRF
jgi:hypothetical protein